MTRAEIAAAVRAILGEHAEVPADEAAALRLESFTLVVLAEDLEARFRIRVTAREVIPDNFGTVGKLIAYIESKLQ
jgi:acyl carrier protein